MPLTEEERKERKAAGDKRYAQANKEKVAAIKRKSYLKNRPLSTRVLLTEEEKKERRKDQKKEYRSKKENIEKNKAYSKAYRQANKERMAAYRKSYYEEHKYDTDYIARDRKSTKAYYNRNKESRAVYAKQYRENNAEKDKASKRNSYVNHRDSTNFKRRFRRKCLSDTYIKQCLVVGSVLSYSDIPLSLIEAKRLELKVNRLIKEQENG